MQTLNIKNLYHIGTLNIEDRTSHNFEGKGLSVSVNPREWLQIARGQISGKSFLLCKDNSKIAMMDNSDISILEKWAIENNLVKTKEVYSYTYFDDDIGRELINYYSSFEEANEELEEEIEHVKKEIVLIATKEIKDIMKPINVSDENPFQALFGLYIQERLPEYDGVWFDAKLDPLGLSAPAGILFDKNISNWNVKEIKEEELPEREE